MRRLLGAGALVALVLLVPMATSSAGAKAKPTTTTAPTTATAPAPPTLGVPHVEELDVVIVPGEFAELRCDPGEVALSASVVIVDNNTGRRRRSTRVPAGYRSTSRPRARTPWATGSPSRTTSPPVILAST